MAGYKSSILKNKPSCFITFDGSTLFDNQGYLRAPYIIDESGNANDGAMMAPLYPIKSYNLGTPSLVGRENGSDQYGITFCPKGQDLSNPFPYEKSLVEVLPAETISLKDEYTIMFLFNKFDADNFFMQAVFDGTKYVTSGTQNKTIRRTLFRKGVTVGMDWRRVHDSGEYLDFIMPGRPTFSLNINNSDNILKDFYNRTFHVTMTRRKESVGTGLWITHDKVYINSRTVFSASSNATSDPSTAHNTSSLFIGGNLDGYTAHTLNDRHTSPISIDQFAVFNNKCLTHDEIANLYKKCFAYEEMTDRWWPDLYSPMYDDKFQFNTTVQNGINRVSVNNVTFQYIGNSSQLDSEQPGPIRLMSTRSVLFKDGGMCRWLSPNTGTVVNSSADYTFEFFAKFHSTQRGVILSAQSDMYPFKGVLIEANIRDGKYAPGSIQVSLEDRFMISTPDFDAQKNPIMYNDGQFHHYIIIRRGSMIEFWLDGVMIGSTNGNSGNMIEGPNGSGFGAIYAMGMMPGNLFVNGNMNNFVFFRHAMEPANIRARSFFFTRMVLDGTVTLQGISHKATLRVMDHKTGKFLREAYSDPNTGIYSFDIYTDNFIDLFVFDDNDPNVRPRAFGPIVASELTDIDGVC